MRFSYRGKPLFECTLEEVFPYTLTITSAPIVDVNERLESFASILAFHLESFSDSIVVKENSKLTGFLAGYETLKGLQKNPTYSYFQNTTAGELQNQKLIIVNKDSLLKDLADGMNEIKRAYAILYTDGTNYSVLSARKFLEIGANLTTDFTLADMPKKKLVTFSKDETVQDIITKMFDNQTRRLFLEGTNSFLTDRTILEKVVNELDMLKGVDNFLSMNAEIFRLMTAEKTILDLTIPTACRTIYNMVYPCLLTKDNIITPWDIVKFISENDG